MKMLRRTNGFEPRLLNLLLFALLLCAFAFSGGCVISPRRIVGGGTGATPTPTPGVSPTPTPVPGAQGKLYVTNLSGNSILRFDNALAANGDATPAAVITGGQTTISSPENIFLDVAADRLYVANQGGSSVLIYDGISTKTGDAPPTRTIFGPNSLLGLPIDVAVDKTRDLLYVADGLDIFVFGSASTANGDPSPTHDIQPLFSISAILVDSANDRLYVADASDNLINVYDSASTLDGFVTTPTRSIAGAATKLNQPSGLAIDALGRLIVSNAGGGGSILVYSNAASANNNIAPIVTITGANTTLNSPLQIAVDPSNTRVEVYVANAGSTTVGGNVPIFSNLGGGTGAPGRNITGPSTTLTAPGRATSRGIALDTTR